MSETWDLFLNKAILFQNRIESIFPSEKSSAKRTLTVAQALHGLLPDSPFALCWLFDGDVLVLDRDDQPQPAWAETLGSLLIPRKPSAESPKPLRIEKLSHEKIPAQGTVVALGTSRGQTECVLALGLEAYSGGSAEIGLEAALKIAADVLAAQLGHERALVELAERARIGDLAAPLAHECSNFLNVVLLQTAVLEMDLPKTYAPQLDEIRQQGGKFKRLIEQFHTYRRRRQPVLSPVDLGAVLSAVSDPKVKSHLPPKLPAVLGTPCDLEHLVQFLCRLAARAGSEPAALYAEAAGATVLLRLECSAAGSREEEADSLEWGACQSLARRLLGKSYQKRQPDGGMNYVVELTAAA